MGFCERNPPMTGGFPSETVIMRKLYGFYVIYCMSV